MSNLTPEQIEGKLNAHRQLLVSLLSVILRPEGRDNLLSLIIEDATFADHEEDPGIEPSDAYAAEALGADEIRSIVEQAKARVDAQARRRKP